MRSLVLSFFLGVWLLGAAEVFEVTASLNDAGDGNGILTVQLEIPADGYLYDAQLQLDLPEGVKAERTGGMKPVLKDADEGLVYLQSGQIIYRLSNVKFPLLVTVAWQGCVSGVCYLPEQKSFSFSESGAKAVQDETGRAKAMDANGDTRLQQWQKLSENLQELGSASGYMSSDDFVNFLQQSQRGKAAGAAENLLARVFSRFGLLLAALLIIPLGLLLNLTPCVLPMLRARRWP